MIIRDDLIEKVTVFILLYILVVFLSGLMLTALNVDALTAFTASATCMGNVGWGFGSIGSMSNFHHIPEAGKIILSLDMLIGRMEIFGFILIFLVKFWKED